ncbi:GspH/FimT family pseudopilin [Thermosulfuriphilus sp.]
MSKGLREKPLFKILFSLAGFSLLEALLVLIITAIVAALAVPSLGRLKEDFALQGAIKTLASDFQYARVASLRRQARVVISLADNASSYQIFVDINNNGSRDNGESILKTVVLPAGVFLSSVSFFGCSSGPQFVRGQPSCLAGGGNGSLRLVSLSTNSFYKLKLSRSGRVVICDKNTDC